MSVTILDESDDHRITFHEFDQNREKTVICFSFQGGGMGPKGFGHPVCEKNGWNYIYVGKRKQTNFRSLSIDNFRSAVQPVLGKDVIAYGASAGANAALFYGGAVNARILAASPRNSSRAGYMIPLEEAAISAFDPTIILDFLQTRDARLTQSWVKTCYPRARLINVPNSGHKSLARVKDAGGLSYLVKTFVQGGEIDAERLEFPAGTTDRMMDDGVRKFLDGDKSGALETFLQDPAFVEYNDAVILCLQMLRNPGNDPHRKRFLSAMGQRANLPPRIARDIAALAKRDESAADRLTC